MTADDLILHARTWLDVPFLHHGRTRLGVDCVGLVIVLLREQKLLPTDFEDSDDYGRRPTDAQLLVALQRHCVQIGRSEPASLVLVKWPHDVLPAHIAFVTGATLIHAYGRVNKVIEQRYGEPWLRMTHSRWRIRGVSA